MPIVPHWEMLADCGFQIVFDQDPWSPKSTNTHFWDKSFM